MDIVTEGRTDYRHIIMSIANPTAVHYDRQKSYCSFIS